MRAFWIILSLLAVGGVVFSLSTLMSGPPAPLPPPPPPASPAAAATPEAAPQPTKAPEAATPVEPPPATAPEKPAAAAAPEAVSAAPAVPTEASPAAAAPAVATPAATPAADPAPAAAASGTEVAGQAGGESAGKIGAYDVLAGKVERRADGTTVLDDRFTVKGEGTLEKPYEVTWELLTSVDQDFDPHSGKKKIPQRIAFLHDKYVKLGGYIAFPMNMQQPRELLLMLNQWDGCCIGVPPTPYDAIEASLNKTVVGDDRFATVGGVVGKMGIKPYVVGDWLVGLYTMEFGDFKPSFGDDGGT
ncbi:MAG: hypothetical protein RL689_2559 [Planctomycetota bacterium]|jgi:hypothetical protein